MKRFKPIYDEVVDSYKFDAQDALQQLNKLNTALANLDAAQTKLSTSSKTLTTSSKHIDETIAGRALALNTYRDTIRLTIDAENKLSKSALQVEAAIRISRTAIEMQITALGRLDIAIDRTIRKQDRLNKKLAATPKPPITDTTATATATATPADKALAGRNTALNLYKENIKQTIEAEKRLSRSALETSASASIGRTAIEQQITSLGRLETAIDKMIRKQNRLNKKLIATPTPPPAPPPASPSAPPPAPVPPASPSAPNSNMKAAETAAIKQDAAMRKLNSSIANQTDHVLKSTASWTYWAKLLVVQVLHLGVYRLIYAIQSSIKSLNDLEVKISEIRTISQSKTLGFEQWYSEIARLSATYGATMEDVTEGIYQTISNQIASGTDSIRFMESALNFARVSVSSTADSVNLLSSAINSFGKSAADTDALAASLFKTIEFGRLRASEIANTLGNTGATAGALGVDFDEMGAALALMTQQGKKSDVALTQLRNIMMQLSKPSEELTELFKSWNVDSGESAIKTYGLAGVLKKLNDEVLKVSETGGSAGAKIAELFKDMRPISGIISLIGNNMDEYNDILAQYSDKQSSYWKASGIVVESTGKKMIVDMQKIKVYLQQEFSMPIRDGIFAVITALGGIPEALSKTMSGMKLAGGIALSYTIAMSHLRKEALLTAEYQGYVTLATEANVKVLKQAEWQAIRTRRAFASMAKVSVTLIAVYALFKVASAAFRQYIDTEVEYAKILKGDDSAVNKLEEYKQKMLDTIDAESKVADERIRILREFATEVGKSYKDIADVTEIVMKESFDNIDKGFESLIKRVTSRVKSLESVLKALKDSMVKSFEKTLDITSGSGNKSYYDSIVKGLDNKEQNPNYKLLHSKDSTHNISRFKDAYYSNFGVRLDEESLLEAYNEFNKFKRKFEITDKIIDLDTKGITDLYQANEVEAARRLSSQLVSDIESLNEFGLTQNEIYTKRKKILNEQLDQENLYRERLKDQETQARTLLAIENKKLATAKFLQSELKSVLKDFKANELSGEGLKIKATVINDQMLALAKDVDNPATEKAIQELIARSEDLTASENMLKTIEELPTKDFKDIKSLKVDVVTSLSAINTNLQALVNLQKVNLTLPKIDKLRAEQEKQRLIYKEALSQQIVNRQQQATDIEKGYASFQESRPSAVRVAELLSSETLLGDMDTQIAALVTALRDPKIKFDSDALKGKGLVKTFGTVAEYAKSPIPEASDVSNELIKGLFSEAYQKFGKESLNMGSILLKLPNLIKDEEKTKVIERNSEMIKSQIEADELLVKTLLATAEAESIKLKGDADTLKTKDGNKVDAIDYGKTVQMGIDESIKHLENIDTSTKELNDRQKVAIALENARQRLLEKELNKVEKEEQGDVFGTKERTKRWREDRLRTKEMMTYIPKEWQGDNLPDPVPQAKGLDPRMPDPANLNKRIRIPNLFDRNPGYESNGPGDTVPRGPNIPNLFAMRSNGKTSQESGQGNSLTINLAGKRVADILIPDLQRAFNRGEISPLNERTSRVA